MTGSLPRVYDIFFLVALGSVSHLAAQTNNAKFLPVGVMVAEIELPTETPTKNSTPDEKGAQDFPLSGLRQCLMRMHEVAKFPYEVDGKSFYTQSVALGGKGRQLLGVFDSERQVFYWFDQKKVYEAKLTTLKPDTNYALSPWIKLDGNHRPLIAYGNGKLLAGNEIDLARSGHLFPSAYSRLEVTETEIFLHHQKSLLSATIFFLDEMVQLVQQKLQASKLQSRYNYHGLMEFSALAQCRQLIKSEATLLSAVESTMDKIAPNWRQSIKMDKSKTAMP